MGSFFAKEKPIVKKPIGLEQWQEFRLEVFKEAELEPYPSHYEDKGSCGPTYSQYSHCPLGYLYKSKIYAKKTFQNLSETEFRLAVEREGNPLIRDALRRIYAKKENANEFYKEPPKECK